MSHSNKKISAGGGELDTNNSTTTPLVADATFTGTATDITGYSTIAILVHSDVASATGGLYVQFSPDGIDWHNGEQYTINANAVKFFTPPAQSSYYRIVYTNGGTDQTTFHLHTTLKTNSIKWSGHNIEDPITDQDDAELTKSVITGKKTNGVYDNVSLTNGGNMKISLEEFETGFYTAPLPVADFLIEVAKGNIVGHSLVHKFGRNAAVGATIVPICDGGNYQMPTSAQALEFVSNATEDALDDVGMHELTINGLDANGDFQEVSTAAHATDGLTAVAISGTWLRVFRAWVSKSGAYATQAVASHEGTITIRGSGGGSTWLTIPEVATNFGAGQSLCGFYTVPAGKTAYILSSSITVDPNRSVDLYFYRRSSITDTTSSYDGTMRLQNIYVGVSGSLGITHKSNEAYPELTDIGFMGAVGTGTADVSAEFELLLVDN